VISILVERGGTTRPRKSRAQRRGEGEGFPFFPAPKKGGGRPVYSGCGRGRRGGEAAVPIT